jgi:hypothetical protein
MMDGREKSDPAIVAVKPTNKAGQPGAELVEPRAGTEGKAGQQSTRRAQNRESVSQALDRIRQAARHRKKERFTTLFHHISLDLLRMAFLDLKRNAAPGVDGLTWRDYEADLDRNLTDLHDRVHRGAYRALPSRRRYIPKADGRQRPLAIAALEDKIVQRATVTVLNAIYEEDFLGFSYGFRPRRSQHDALDALVVGISSTKMNYILDADIAGFFDAVSQEWLVRFLNHRIGDPPDPEMAEGGHPGRRGRDGQRQGDRARIGGITAARQRLPALRFRPLGQPLATAGGHRRHDHRALRRRYRGRLRARGPALLGGHARAVTGVRVVAASGQLLEFGRFAAANRKRRGLGKPETFTFLGFTFICGRTRRGDFQIHRKTRRDRMQAKLTEIKEELRRRMHQSIPQQGRWLRQVVTGYYNYHAVPTNSRALEAFHYHVIDLWRRTLRRRSQKDGSTWERIAKIANDWLPKPRILHPWPQQRFAVRHPRWEPYAGMPHVRICAGGAQ